MAVATYCTSEEVAFLWSEYGVELRIDDRDALSSTQRMEQALEKASADVNSYLLENYPLASLQNNAWVKWATAHCCAVDLARRRGESPPDGLFAEYQRYMDFLKEIRAGGRALISDAGLAAPRFDNLPFVTNLRVDSRFTQKVRRIVPTSTQMPQAPSRRGFDSTSLSYLYW